jgi:putative oxidoreductase
MNEAMTVLRLVARPMLASMFVVGGANALRNVDMQAQRAKPVTDKMTELADRFAPNAPIPKDEKTLVRINGVTQIVSGLMLATGRMPRMAALTLAGTLVPTTLAGHRYWEEADPNVRANSKTHFVKNLSMLGGLLLAAVDTEGKPGVAWRTKHALGDARREAKHLRRGAKAQARIAAKSVKR